MISRKHLRYGNVSFLFKKISSYSGKVPVLIDDGFTIYESRAICRYLIAKYQGTKNSTILIPSDVHKAALANQFLSVEESYFDPPGGKLYFEVAIRKLQGQKA